jgi:CheY-like chemotaxis protein
LDRKSDSKSAATDDMALKFLVLDDDENTISLTTQVIEKAIAGSQVYAARTNEEAFRILASITPNLITTDIIHPGGDGFNFLTRLRSVPKTAFIPVIAISGNSSDNQQLAYYKHGFDAVVPKPWQTQELIAAITRLLRLRADPNIQLVHLGFETQSLDYKEKLDLESKSGRASLAKDVVAMANWGGGTIVVGVAERQPGEFVPQGVPDSVLGSFETSCLNRAVNEFLDPPVPITVRRVQDGNQVFVLLSVAAATDSLVLVKRQNEDAGIYPGRIYSRSSAAESAEVRTSSELRELLERLRRRKD